MNNQDASVEGPWYEQDLDSEHTLGATETPQGTQFGSNCYTIFRNVIQM
jgi:hypothetical protein